MVVKLPQADLPRRIRGGSDEWAQPQASVVLRDDYFAAASEDESAARPQQFAERLLSVGRMLGR